MAKINPRLINGRDSYTVKELSKKLNVDEKTILTWHKQGLEKIECSYPYLFYGLEIKAFLNQRKEKKKVKLQDNEFYCLRCRQASKSPNDEIVIRQLDSRVGKNNFKKLSLLGSCKKCGTFMSRLSNEGRLDEINSIFKVIDFEES